MRGKTLVLMVVAVGCGLAASFMTSRLIAEKNQPVEEEKVAVLVAKQNLEKGLVLKKPEDQFEEKLYRKGEEPKRALRTFDDLRDKRLNKPVNQESFVTQDDLVDKMGEGLPGQMQKGMRAFTIRVDPQAAVAGLILPDSRVDIVAVIKGDENSTRALTILQNVQVLAVNDVYTRQDEKTSIVATTVTVQVTPRDQQLLSVAQSQGDLRLTLRSWDDDKQLPRDKGVTLKSLLNGDQDDREELKAKPKPTPADLPVVKAEPKKPEPKMHLLTINNGDEVTRASYPLPNDEEPRGKVEKVAGSRASK